MIMYSTIDWGRLRINTFHLEPRKHFFNMFKRFLEYQRNASRLGLPDVFLSNWKWNFLFHGAFRCLPRTILTLDTIDIYCMNSPAVQSARYIALKDDDKENGMLYQLRQTGLSILIISAGGM